LGIADLNESVRVSTADSDPCMLCKATTYLKLVTMNVNSGSFGLSVNPHSHESKLHLKQA